MKHTHTHTYTYTHIHIHTHTHTYAHIHTHCTPRGEVRGMRTRRADVGVRCVVCDVMWSVISHRWKGLCRLAMAQAVWISGTSTRARKYPCIEPKSLVLYTHTHSLSNDTTHSYTHAHTHALIICVVAGAEESKGDIRERAVSKLKWADDGEGLCCAVPYCAVLCCTVPWCAVMYRTVLYCTVLCCAVLRCAVLYCTVLCCAVLYCAVLYCAVLC